MGALKEDVYAQQEQQAVLPGSLASDVLLPFELVHADSSVATDECDEKAVLGAHYVFVAAAVVVAVMGLNLLSVTFADAMSYPLLYN